MASTLMNSGAGSKKPIRKSAQEVIRNHENITGTARNPMDSVPEVTRNHKRNMTGAGPKPTELLPEAMQNHGKTYGNHW